MEIKEYIFQVETVRSGQVRKYGPTENEYIITNKCDRDYAESVIERFCKGFLKPPVRFKDSPCWADSKETFEKIGDRKYRYAQHVPSTH